MRYLVKHWRGELPLAVSFWINLVLLNLAIIQFRHVIENNLVSYDPVLGAQITVIAFVLSVFVIYPWQIVGTWKSANRSIKKNNSRLWPYLAELIIILGLITNVVNIKSSLILYQELAKIGFIGDEYNNYSVRLSDTGSFIHITGNIGPGLYSSLKEFADNGAELTIKGVVLDSGGGRTHAARKIAELILENNWDTYTTVGCYSACTIAFAAGNNRYLSIGANIGFHSYSAGSNDRLNAILSFESEQEHDRGYFASRGIKEQFLAGIFTAGSEDMWYPTVEELLDSRFITDIVKPSSIPMTNDVGDMKELLSIIENSRLYHVIRKYRPDDYQNLLDRIREGAHEGAGFAELQYLVSQSARQIAEQVIPKAPDDLLIRFLEENVELVKSANNRASLHCVKLLYGGSFGAVTGIDDREYQLLNKINLTMAQIIEASSGQHEWNVDAGQAESDLTRIFSRLGSRISYLDPQSLKNTSDYKQACEATIEMNNMILSLGKANAANLLRYKYNRANKP